MEEFKALKGMPEYQISNYGRLYSKKTNKYLTCSPNSDGYPSFVTRYNKKVYSVKIHRLVAEYFMPNPENKPQVNHIDGDKTNNHYANLEWVTKGENATHAYHTGLFTRLEKGVDHYASYIDKNTVWDIREALKDRQGRTQRDIAKQFNVSEYIVSRIKLGKVYKSV